MFDTSKIDIKLLRRQRLALMQAIEESPHPLRTILLNGLLELTHKVEESMEPRYKEVYCSQCGKEFGPGDCGYSHCEDHD